MMKERINRKTDENLYQPRIHSRRIRELYTLKEVTGIPMTVLVDLAIRDFIEKSEAEQGITYNHMQEREPQKEASQQNCNYCGPGWPAVWEVVTDEGDVFVCDNHHFVLRQIHVVGLERKVGEENWVEVFDFGGQDLEGEYLDDLGDWKELINYDDL